MPRSVVGLLAAVGAALSILAGLTGLSHSDLVWVVSGSASAATGLAAYLALPSTKKSPQCPDLPTTGTGMLLHAYVVRPAPAWLSTLHYRRQADGFCQGWA